MFDAKSWFIENYKSPIAEPADDSFPAPRFSCKDLGITPPASVQASTAWYWDHLADCGGAWSLRYEVEGGGVFVVFAGTDGDEGAVELFDAEGRPHCSAFLCGDEQHWEPLEQIRQRFLALYAAD